MCHERVVIPLTPGINFLQGSSSSGKSAVLVAIKLCLSTKEIARPEFIRHPWAGNGEIAIKLHNNAQDGFKYAAYGASVTVKRVLFQQGGSELQLISDAGQVISNDTADVSTLLILLCNYTSSSCILPRSGQRIMRAACCTAQ
jgi:structural maintenance of chromosomes protein 6